MRLETKSVGGRKVPFFIMVTNKLSTHIANFLEDYFQNTDLFLVDVKISGKQSIQVFVDRSTKNINIDTCAEISRYLEKQLEENGLVSEKYKIDVSSPGMTNGFKVKQQYQKNLGREVQVITHEFEEMNGVLKEADEKCIVLEMHKQVKKRMPPEIEVIKLPYEELKSVKKKITFK